MRQTAGQTLFSVLRDVAARQLGREHPCWRAIDAALVDGEVAAAQAALHALEPATLERLMSETHKIMREDPAHILEAWGGGAPKH